jgi:hypothetical protein
MAAERRREGRLAELLRERDISRFACFFARFDAVLDAGSFTPARRALESPIAIACLVERAPCFPSRMWCISSRTNSPACVEADFPSRASFLARSIVSRSGMLSSCFHVS